MKTKMAAASVAFTLAAATLGLAAGPASAASAGRHARPHGRVTVGRLPAGELATLKLPHDELSCLAKAKDSPPLFIAAERLDWCTVFPENLLYEQGGKVVGKAAINVIFYASWKVSSRTWASAFQSYQEYSSSGALKGKPVSVAVTNSCKGGCYVYHNRHYSLTVPSGDKPAEKDIGVESRGDETVTGSLTATWVYKALGVTFYPPGSNTTVGVRCDSEQGYKYPAGCANPRYTPTYVLSSAKYPAIAKFDKAEIAKHPSWSTLTRVSPEQTRMNRRAACRGFHPPPPYSCDEFPYASTAQGGKGAAVKKVLLSENTSQGNNLGAFYNANRLFYGEKFHVKIS
jgi:hypothetical protein